MTVAFGFGIVVDFHKYPGRRSRDLRGPELAIAALMINQFPTKYGLRFID